MQKQQWELYKKQELENAKPVLDELGFILDEKQPHIEGERYLMSGYKLVLLGKQKKDQKKVIIKVSSRKPGKKEIEYEHQARQKLNKINFAYHSFFLPAEILFTRHKNFLISITIFINQPKPFLAYSFSRQFFLALQAFEAQEGVHAIAYSHLKDIKKIFKIITPADYLNSFADFKKNILFNQPELANLLNSAQDFLKNNQQTIELYSNFLTHSDFVPHNIRIVDHQLYLLDHTSLYFGNKYESWARFINYMTLHNQNLAQALADYVLKNRGQKEYLSLRLMRVYKLGFLLQFYVQSFLKAEGNLRLLSQKRIEFWSQVLKNVLADTQTPTEIIKAYQRQRDSLRSQAEKTRQKNL